MIGCRRFLYIIGNNKNNIIKYGEQLEGLSGAAARTWDLKGKNIIKVFIQGKLAPVNKNNNAVIMESSNRIEDIWSKHLLKNCVG